jgi:drug/metabolite transporter (DMT)-like permease
MGLMDNRSEHSGQDPGKSPEQILNAVQKDLKVLQQDLVAQLNQDVRRLQKEKARLINDIDRLKDQREMLQSQHSHLLSQQQLAQQQMWAKQLAQAMASHLYTVLAQRMAQSPPVASGHNGVNLPVTSSASNGSERALAALDATVNHALSSLQQDLNSYQSSLSAQISRMQTLEQQGEAILEALVSRLSHQLRQDMSRTNGYAAGSVKPPPNSQPSVTNGGRTTGTNGRSQTHPNAGYGSSSPASHRAGYNNGHTRSTAPPPPPPHLGSGRNGNGSSRHVLPTAPAIAPEPTVAPVRPKAPLGLSQFQLGLIMILCSTVALSLHNVVVGIIGNPSSIFGIFDLGGYIRLNSFGNSLLILWMRMLVVVPLMAFLATFLYPRTWRDIKTFSLSNDRPLLVTVIGSGFFLFLSQVLIYIAIGQIGPGVAVTILFMYPVITVPLAWFLFGDRPTPLRLGVMGAILLGVVLTALPKLGNPFGATNANIPLGLTTATISGLAFACYLISMQISFRKLHPVPVSLIQFTSIFVLASLSLIFLPLGVEVIPDMRLGLFAGGIVLGALTLAGYLLNNFGVRFMGAAMASVVASSGPVLTALLAFLVTPGDRTALTFVQVIGIIVVTLGVAALSFEKLLLQRKANSNKG